MLSYKRARGRAGLGGRAEGFPGEGPRPRPGHRRHQGRLPVNVGGVTAFLPASLADLHPVRIPARMVNTGVRCYIIELNEAKRQLVLSRKAVLEEEAAKRRAQLIAELRVGEVRIGRVLHVGRQRRDRGHRRRRGDRAHERRLLGPAQAAGRAWSAAPR